jgi:hypothetical protein
MYWTMSAPMLSIFSQSQNTTRHSVKAHPHNQAATYNILLHLVTVDGSYPIQLRSKGI